jgi:hypothetical protein
MEEAGGKHLGISTEVSQPVFRAAVSSFLFCRMTQYFQVIKGFGPLGTGTRLLPVAGSVAVASVTGTRLAVRIGNKIIVGGGDVVLRGAAVDLHGVPGNLLTA